MLPSVAMTVQPLPVEWGQLLVDWRQRELAWFPEPGEQKSAMQQRGLSPLLAEQVGRPAYPVASSRPLPAPESAPYRQGNSPSHPFCDWKSLFRNSHHELVHLLLHQHTREVPQLLF
jgi:hypothetical protein